MNARAIRLGHRYTVSYLRGQERRTFTVWGFNKGEAFAEAHRRLEQTGERESAAPGGWWCVGIERESA